jgi:hypothetical protein
MTSIHSSLHQQLDRIWQGVGFSADNMVRADRGLGDACRSLGEELGEHLAALEAGLFASAEEDPELRGTVAGLRRDYGDVQRSVRELDPFLKSDPAWSGLVGAAGSLGDLVALLDSAIDRETALRRRLAP